MNYDKGERMNNVYSHQEGELEMNSLLRSVKDIVHQFAPLARVYLFGSRSKGNAKLDSDWDLLILLDEDQIKPKENLIKDALYDLELETAEVINPLIYPMRDWFGKYKVTPFYASVMDNHFLL